MKKLKRNKVKCKKCGDILESKFLHDFKYCTCGAIAIDGGLDYARVTGEPEDVLDLHEWEDEIEDVL